MSAGALSGLIPMPFILDRLGRKPCLVIGAFFMLLGIALQSAAVNFAMFIAARWILGFGDILVICTAPLLIAEIAPVQDRAILVTIAGANYQSGAFIAAWTTYGTLQIKVSHPSPSDTSFFLRFDHLSNHTTRATGLGEPPVSFRVFSPYS